MVPKREAAHRKRKMQYTCKAVQADLLGCNSRGWFWNMLILEMTARPTRSPSVWAKMSPAILTSSPSHWKPYGSQQKKKTAYHNPLSWMSLVQNRSTTAVVQSTLNQVPRKIWNGRNGLLKKRHLETHILVRKILRKKLLISDKQLWERHGSAHSSHVPRDQHPLSCKRL